MSIETLYRARVDFHTPSQTTCEWDERLSSALYNSEAAKKADHFEYCEMNTMVRAEFSCHLTAKIALKEITEVLTNTGCTIID